MDENEAAEIIKKRLSQLGNDIFSVSVGTVISISSGIAIVSGLYDVFFHEVVRFPCGVNGVVFSIDEYTVTVIILGNSSAIMPGMEVTRTKKEFSIYLSPYMIGRVVNGFGDPIDGEILGCEEERNVERKPLSILDIEPISEQILTGINAIDWFIPIGFGQRQLIAGNPFTGKTSIVKMMMRNLKEDPKVIFIYASIGQKISHGPSFFQEMKDVENLIMVVANSSDCAIMRYYAPFVACTIAEYYKDLGYRAIVIYDDLSQHALAHREISLLMKTNVGREAYPGDVTYLHSRLLERSANFKIGSVTAIPIVTLENDDLAQYIATNVVSITDGQIVLESGKFTKNQKPAINIGLSVSRIGSGIQTPFLRKLSGSLKLSMAKAEKVIEMEKFSSSTTSTELIDLYNEVSCYLAQSKPYPLYISILILYCIVNKKPIDIDKFTDYEEKREQIIAGHEILIEGIICNG